MSISLNELAKYCVVGFSGLQNKKMFKKQYSMEITYPIPESTIVLRIVIVYCNNPSVLQNIQSFIGYLVDSVNGGDILGISLPFSLAQLFLLLLLPLLCEPSEPYCCEKKCGDKNKCCCDNGCYGFIPLHDPTVLNNLINEYSDLEFLQQNAPQVCTPSISIPKLSIGLGGLKVN